MSKKDLPAVSAVLDSAALAQLLAAVPPGDAARILLSLGVGKDAGTPAIQWVEPKTGPDTLIRLVSGAALPRTPGNPWAVRVRIDLGARPAIALEPAVYCPPQPSITGGETMSVGQVVVGPGDRMPAPGARIRMVAEVMVLESGAVAEVRLISGSGIRDIDDGFVEHLRSTVFLPALLEGMPVPGRYRNDGSSPRP